MEEIQYRSKDKTFMRKLKRAIYQGADSDEEKEWTWEFMSRRVLTDDLHRYAVEELDIDELVDMGQGDLHAHLLVLTMKPTSLSQEGQELIRTIVGAGKFKHVYYTAKYKVARPLKSQVKVFDEILETQIKALKPKAILCFGEVLPVGLHQVEEYMGVPVIQTHLVSTVLKEEDEEQQRKLKNEIWTDVKEIRKHYKK